MSLKDFKVLTFDVVGTLIDFEQGMLNYMHKVAPDTKVDDEEFLIGYRNSRARQKVGWYPDDLARVWVELAGELNLPTSTAIAEGFRDSVDVWPAFPDSVEALKRLGKHFHLVAMTNTQRWAYAHFDRTLGKPFNDSVTCDDAQCEKPDPMFFAYAQGLLGARGFTRQQNLHVAQSQYHDIGIAHSLGLATCWIERRHAQPGFGGTLSVEKITKPDFHFHSLAQLADAVEAGA